MEIMGMSKDDFKRAFREVVSSEFAKIPLDENDHCKPDGSLLL